MQKEYDNIEKIFSYIEYPLVNMKAGGTSWKNELNALKELKKSAIKNNAWNINTRLFYWGRVFRTRMKTLLTIMKLRKIVTIWRNIKWK